jgi:hypothetical protein
MKKCPRCQEDFPLDEFQSPSGGKANSYCKVCKLAYDKAYYKNNKSRQEKQRGYNEKALERNRKFVWDFLAESECVDCGESNPIVLEFDHVRGTKEVEIGKAVHRLVSIAKIQKEIDKCEVRCANCHRKVTHQRAETWKDRESRKV